MIPTKWQDALLELQTQDPTAIIAGGAIRDIFCGRQVKDVDFFCANHAAHFSNKFGASTTKDYKGMQYVLGIVDYAPDGDVPFSIIYHDSPDNMTLLSSFDFGLCQIGWNGKELIKTPAFDWDFKYGVMTLRRGDRHQRAIERYERINKKYGWPMVIGEGVVVDNFEKELF